MYEINNEIGNHIVEIYKNRVSLDPSITCVKGIKAMTTALHFADVEYGASGIIENASNWAENKDSLIHLLEKSSDWNPEIMAVVKDVEYTIEVPDYEKHDALSFFIRVLQDEIGQDNDEVKIKAKLMGHVESGNIKYGSKTFLKERIESPEELEFIQDVLGYQRVQIGMKYSRLVQKMVKEWDANAFEGRNNSLESAYNAWVDKISDKKQKYKYVLSVNPADFLLMSYGNSWTSCQIINPRLPSRGEGYSGQYRAGTMSYMCDENSAVSYLAPVETPMENIPYVPKINRQIVFLHPNIPAYFTSRMYPASNDSPFYNLFENTLAPIMDECHSTQGGQWEWKDASFSEHGHAHYEDYRCFSSVCRSKQYIKTGGQFRNFSYIVGSITHCLECGEEYNDRSNTSCRYCGGGEDDDHTRCSQCDEIVHNDDIYWVHDEAYCDSCFCNDCFSCDDCGEYEFNDDSVRTEDYRYICQHCYERNYATCIHCGEVFDPRNCGTFTDDGYVCDDCYSQHCFTCEHCGESYDNEDAVTDVDGDAYCENCAGMVLACCETCNEWFDPKHHEVHMHDGYIYCEDCYEEEEEDEEDDVEANSQGSETMSPVSEHV
jgi:hypothetical protein